MHKRLLLNLVLLVVVGGLLLFYSVSDRQVTDDPMVLLSDIETTNINQIIINRSADDNIIFNKQQGRWMLTAPVRARANMARINALLRLPRSRSFTRIVAAHAALAPYRLDPAAVTLHLGSYTFLFGTTDPLDERRYVLFDNSIHLINDSLFPQLLQAPMFFVSTRLIPEEEIIGSIRFADHLVTKVNQHWSLSPAAEAVSAMQLQDLVNAWQTAEARQVRRYKGIDAIEKIILNFNSGHTAQFDVVAITPNLILGRVDLALQYSLDRNLSDRLLIRHGIKNDG